MKKFIFTVVIIVTGLIAYGQSAFYKTDTLEVPFVYTTSYQLYFNDTYSVEAFPFKADETVFEKAKESLFDSEIMRAHGAFRLMQRAGIKDSLFIDKAWEELKKLKDYVVKSNDLNLQFYSNGFNKVRNKLMPSNSETFFFILNIQMVIFLLSEIF